MNSATYKLLEKLLEGKWFGVCVDLGCGEGYYGPLLKKHCPLLIGVDHNLGRLSVAKKFAEYDQVFYMEVQDYTPPPGTEAVFMIEVIEHLPKLDGQALLQRLSHIPFTVITTPVEFHRFTLRNHHQSLWTENELQAYGFKTQTYTYAFPSLRKGIFAVKEL